MMAFLLQALSERRAYEVFQAHRVVSGFTVEAVEILGMYMGRSSKQYKMASRARHVDTETYYTNKQLDSN